MKNQIFFIMLFIAVFPFKNWAQTVVISDIDDTIRETHVLSKKRLIAPVKIQTAFHNMSKVYQALKKKNGLEFYYLTSAPQKIMKRSHTRFLLQNNFPDGIIKFRSLFNSQNHKLNSIREIISTKKMDTLILIGDNGEKDPEIYKNIQNFIEENNLDIKVLSYIKINYSLHSGGSIIFDDQIPFVVASELAYIFKNEGFINAEAANSIINNSLNEDKALIVPYWVRPSQYPTNFKLEDILSDHNIARIQNEIDRISQ